MAMRKLLIANRGEIARRIRRTANAMGVRTVAVYTASERDAPFVAESDDAVLLPAEGPAPYLDMDAIIEAARKSGADSVHPGYGFLAENAVFAQAVVDAGLVWVGPPAEAIARMGDKLESKRVAAKAGVPALDAIEATEGAAIELPVLVKAAMGGGGKGMRIVRTHDELASAVAAARREAERAFGDGTVFLEPFLERSRHVEIQVLGDAHGNVIHVGERECSIQRRHQKVIEESPSVAVDSTLREKMGEAALSLAREIGYRNAGTVEFLLAADGRFFFLEMNTRLQVEHPVTEAVYGVDLVREQLLDAGGEALSIAQPSVPSGHAIEARLNAEDPANDYLPATGVLVRWEPADGARYESGVATGSVVGTSFDPLIGKVIAHAPTRAEAASALALALERTTIQGVQTNRDVLVGILRSEAFGSGDTTTDFIDRVEIAPRRVLSGDEREAALAAVVLHAQAEARSQARVLTTFPAGWRNSMMPPQRRIFVLDGEEISVAYERRRDGVVLIEGKPARLATGTIELDGRGFPIEVTRADRSWWVHGRWGDVEILERSPFPSSEIEEASGSLHAPMPGSVVSVEVSVGESVRKGQTLVVLEAMKMEHPIGSPEDGVVAEVKVSTGDQVERGALLVVVEGAKLPRSAGGPGGSAPGPE